ncbi:hypothetical protein MNBD_UNCLBAC01-609 [hydrothermal vent metagenome]|uniref:Uncharacterized protein n=1 Tax=hydrothermal vent metagenome TaxID=652676 RepID=A0A3B1E134_9ZZZZ
MLSEQEKREMLEDARSVKRRENFEIGRRLIQQNSSCELDDYLLFLKESQKFFPIESVPHKTKTDLNRL